MNTTSSQSGKLTQHPSKRVWTRGVKRGVRKPQVLTTGMKYWIGAAGAYYGLLALGTHLVLH